MQNQPLNPLEQEGRTLLNKYDADPGPFRPFHYTTEIDVPVVNNGIGRGSITTNQQPFVFLRLSHQIIGNTADPETSGLYQDGQYTILYKDEMSNYQKEPTMADILAGSVRSGFISWLPMPLGLAGSRSFYFEIVNRVTRVLSPTADYFKVAITMHGMADWGELVAPSQGRR